MKQFSKFFFLFSLILLMASCNKEMPRKDRVASMISSLDSPFFISTFKPETIIDKSGVKDGALPFTYQTFLSFFILEGKTGVDNSEQIQIALSKGDGIVPSFYAFVPLKNASVFRTAAEKELSAKIQEKDGVSFFRKDDDNYVVAWKDDIAVVTNVPIKLENIFSKSANDSKKAAVGLVKLINGANLENIDTNYRNFLDKEGDLLTYINGKTTYGMLSSLRIIPFKQKGLISDLLENTKIESVLSFEEGVLKLQTKHLFPNNLKKKLNFLGNGGVNEDMLKFGRSEKPLISYASNLSSTGVVDFINSYAEIFNPEELDGEIEGLGLGLKDLETLFTGEVLMMIDGVETKTNDGDVNIEEPVIGVVIDLKDIDKASNYITQIEAMDSLSDKVSFRVVLNDKLFISNSEEWMTMVKNGESVTIENRNGQLTNSAFGMVSNTGSFKGFEKDLKTLGVAMNNIDEIVGEMSLDMSNFEIKLKNSTQNALRTIIEIILAEYQKLSEFNNSSLKDLLDEEVLESIQTKVEQGCKRNCK